MRRRIFANRRCLVLRPPTYVASYESAISRRLTIAANACPVAAAVRRRIFGNRRGLVLRPPTYVGGYESAISGRLAIAANACPVAAAVRRRIFANRRCLVLRPPTYVGGYDRLSIFHTRSYGTAVACSIGAFATFDAVAEKLCEIV